MNRHLLPVFAAVALVAVGCPSKPKLDPKRAKDTALNETIVADIYPGRPTNAYSLHRINVPGEGNVDVVLEPVNQTAQLEVQIFPQGPGALPLAVGPSPLQAPGVPAGTYFVAITPKNSVPTRTKVSINYEPKDPDAKTGDDKETSPVKIDPGQTYRGGVDYTNMDASDYLVLTLPEGGSLTIKAGLTNMKGKVAVDVKQPKGDWAPIDPRGGLEIKEATKGDYNIRVVAAKGSVASYAIESTFEAGDPDGASGDDGQQEGANEMTLAAKGAGQNPKAVAKDEVDFDKRDRTDWYKFEIPDKGKLSVVLKPKDRSSKIRAELVKNDGDDDGDRIKSGFSVDVEKKPYWVKVFAPDKGDKGAYTLEVEYIPTTYVDSAVVQIDKKDGCVLMVNKGSNHGVRVGVPANVMSGDQVVGNGMVEQAFPAISKIKVFGACNYTAGTTVKIQGGGY